MATDHRMCSEYLNQAFSYDSGRLFWKERPVHHFKNERASIAWNANYAGKEAGNIYKSGKGFRCCIRLNGKNFSRYTIIWAFHKNEHIIGIDHSNRNPLDDRIENLRPATQIQNSANLPIRIDNNTGHKGVGEVKRNYKLANKYRARIKINYKEKHLGYFATPEEAHEAYMEAAKEASGEFACGG